MITWSSRRSYGLLLNLHIVGVRRSRPHVIPHPCWTTSIMGTRMRNRDLLGSVGSIHWTPGTMAARTMGHHGMVWWKPHALHITWSATHHRCGLLTHHWSTRRDGLKSLTRSHTARGAIHRRKSHVWPGSWWPGTHIGSHVWTSHIRAHHVIHVLVLVIHHFAVFRRWRSLTLHLHGMLLLLL